MRLTRPAKAIAGLASLMLCYMHERPETLRNMICCVPTRRDLEWTNIPPLATTVIKNNKCKQYGSHMSEATCNFLNGHSTLYTSETGEKI